MNDVLTILVGINHWNDITYPLIKSIRLNEPSCELVVVDNLSEPPYPVAAYPYADEYKIVRTKQRVGYGVALNYAIKKSPKAEQYILLNNDNMCRKPFINFTKTLERNTVWGSFGHPDNKNHINFVQSAWFVISREIWEKVGEFDPALSAAYEDLDYEMRAWKAGFEVKIANLPFDHLDCHTRFEEEDYWNRWEAAMKVFSEKWKIKEAPWKRK